MFLLAEVLLEEGRFDEAGKLFRENLEHVNTNWPGPVRVAIAQSHLAACLIGQQKYADSEPLLLSGYEALKQREDKLSPANRPRLKEALQRLVQLYVETNKPDRAAEWNAKLAEFEKANAAQ